MKAISLHQPWATFVARGWKRIETRSWGTTYRGPIAIHAAKSHDTWKESGPTYDLHLLHKANIDFGPWKGSRIPAYLDRHVFGAVVAVANLDDCILVHDVDDDPADVVSIYAGKMRSGRRVIERAELVLGNLQEPMGGRFAWMLEDVKPLRTPVPARGYQGLWEVEAGLESDVRSALT